MNRQIRAILIITVFSSVWCGCKSNSDIGKDKAAEIALEDASVAKSDTTRLHITKENDDGRSLYEVEFISGDTEYEYEILASSGEIISSDYSKAAPAKDLQNQTQRQEQDQAQQDAPSKADDNAQTQTPAQDNGGAHHSGQETHSSHDAAPLSLEEASQIALARVPGSTSENLEIKLDYDDGIAKYEGEILYNQTEYEFEIDAATGDFLEWSEEQQ